MTKLEIYKERNPKVRDALWKAYVARWQARDALLEGDKGLAVRKILEAQDHDWDVLRHRAHERHTAKAQDEYYYCDACGARLPQGCWHECQGRATV